MPKRICLTVMDGFQPSSCNPKQEPFIQHKSKQKRSLDLNVGDVCKISDIFCRHDHSASYTIVCPFHSGSGMCMSLACAGSAASAKDPNADMIGMCMSLVACAATLITDTLCFCTDHATLSCPRSTPATTISVREDNPCWLSCFAALLLAPGHMSPSLTG